MIPQKSRTDPANTPAQPAAAGGQPAKDPQPQRPLDGKQPHFKDQSAEQTLELPRDRDEAADMTSGQTSPIIEQAAKDISQGRQDTSKAQETDQAYKKLKP